MSGLADIVTRELESRPADEDAALTRRVRRTVKELRLSEKAVADLSRSLEDSRASVSRLTAALDKAKAGDPSDLAEDPGEGMVNPLPAVAGNPFEDRYSDRFRIAGPLRANSLPEVTGFLALLP